MPRIYLQTYGNVRVVSLQNDNDTINAGHPGQTFSVRIGENNIIRLRVEEDNKISITSPDHIRYSFDIGYNNWPMASILYEKVEEIERFIFGEHQLHINNNWRLTTGPTEYVLNTLIHQLQVNQNRQLLFRVIIDREEPEPHRVGIRIRPYNFATLFFAANQLLQIRYNGNYLIDVLQRMQRLNMQNVDQFAVVPFHDPHFLEMFRFMEGNRLPAIEAPPENIRAFNRHFRLALEALYPQHIVFDFIQQIENVGPEELLDLEPAPEQNLQDVLREFYDNA